MSEVSLIVPMRDEAGRMALHLPRLFRWCRDRGAELVLCDDGSRDATLELSRFLARSQGLEPRCLRLPRRGKGAAVASGLLAATGRVRLMVDADVPVELEDLDRLLEAVDDADEIVVGSRRGGAGRRHDGTWSRRILSWAASLLSRELLGGVSDSQCGCKAWTARSAQRLCACHRIDGFAFDFEQIHCARRVGVKVKEIAVTWTPREGSHVRPLAHGLRFAFDVLRILWVHRSLVPRAI